MKLRPSRVLAAARALLGGWFWLPCPACGEEFGGHEWADVDGHFSSIPYDVRRDSEGEIALVGSKGICPACTGRGVGCIAHKAAGTEIHLDCKFLEAETAGEART